MSDALRAEIASVNESWNAAFNRGDARAVAALYADDAQLSPGDGRVLTGRAEIEKLFQSFIDNGVHHHFIDIASVHGEGDLAYEVGTWGAEGAEQDGAAPSFGGTVVHVFRRSEDGGWKSKLHIWNLAG